MEVLGDLYPYWCARNGRRVHPVVLPDLRLRSPKKGGPKPPHRLLLVALGGSQHAINAADAYAKLRRDRLSRRALNG
jgi:hypothetical protein